MPKHIKQYQAQLNAFLSHRDNNDYPVDHVFKAEVLNRITPEEIVAFLHWKAFGIENPGDDDCPTKCRSSTLAFAKKSLSYFIPNKHKLWDVETLRGNATRSPEVNAVIDRVKKSEVRSEGVPSQARRALTEAEFCIIMRIAEKHVSSNTLKLRLPTMAKFQVHLIARIDDTAHLRFADLKVHPQFDFALTIKLRWTKNCNEERQAPDQIMLGANDSDFCVLVAFAIYIQFALEFTNADNSEYIFCDTEETPDSVKQQVSVNLKKKVIESEEWIELQRQTHGDSYVIDKCGTHSLRKFATTLARLIGSLQDEVEARGRWRDTQRVSDRYTSIALPGIDADVASNLAVGGPVKYKVRADNTKVTNPWLIGEFVPQIAKKCGNGVAVVLGHALLWALVETTMSSMIPEVLRSRLQWRYMGLHPDPEMNPIIKVELHVHSNCGQLLIDEIGSEDNDDNDATVGTVGGASITRNRNSNMHPMMKTLIAQNNALRQQNQELKRIVNESRDTLHFEMRIVKRVLNKVANRPAQITSTINIDNNNNNNNTIANTITAPAESNYISSLSKAPASLYELWEEYEFGREGRKAA